MQPDKTYFPPRPTPLTIVATLSLVGSALTVLAVIFKIFFGALVGVGSWLLGPIVGLIGSVVGIGMILTTLLQSILSLMLFSAALKTFEGDYRGRTLHQVWAWITIALQGFPLVFGGHLSRLGWWSLLYALLVLYVMRLPEVLAYFFGVEFGRPKRRDEWASWP
jgi:hypothetical protein